LATRPKKLQLIEDRRQLVVSENARLMERMTKIMSSTKVVSNFERMAGRNEAYRRHQIDRINAENRSLVDRLQKVPSVLSVAKFEQDFKKHLQDMKSLSKYQMSRISPKKTRLAPIVDGLDMGGMNLGQSTDDPGYGNPITAIADYRKQIITNKKLHSSDGTGGPMSSGSSGKRDASPQTYSLYHNPN
jgi:Hemingway/CFA97